MHVLWGATLELPRSYSAFNKHSYLIICLIAWYICRYYSPDKSILFPQPRHLCVPWRASSYASERKQVSAGQIAKSQVQFCMGIKVCEMWVPARGKEWVPTLYAWSGRGRCFQKCGEPARREDTGITNVCYMFWRGWCRTFDRTQYISVYSIPV